MLTTTTASTVRLHLAVQDTPTAMGLRCVVISAPDAREAERKLVQLPGLRQARVRDVSTTATGCILCG